MDIELERTNHKNRLHYRTKENIKIFAIVFILFILSRVLLTFAACIYNYVHEGYTRTWELLYHYDALWYVDIVDNGYQSTPNSGTGYANYAFYPFYPIVLRFLKNFLPDRFTTNQIGIMVSNVCALIAGFLGVKTARLRFPKDEAYFMAFLIFLRHIQYTFL